VGSKKVREYVLGFFYSSTGVVLIEKVFPWSQGRCVHNGIGGNIVKGETGYDAMVREFKEETGLVTTKNQWKFIVCLAGRSKAGYQYIVNVFWGRGHVPKNYFDKLILPRQEGAVNLFSELPDNTDSTARWIHMMLTDRVMNDYYVIFLS